MSLSPAVVRALVTRVPAQSLAQMWNDGDDAVKRGMARAVKAAWGMRLTNRDGRWVIAIGETATGSAENMAGIVDLGNGLCFRR